MKDFRILGMDGKEDTDKQRDECDCDAMIITVNGLESEVSRHR